MARRKRSTRQPERNAALAKHIDDAVKFAATSAELENVADYVARGRQLKALSQEELDARFVMTMEAQSRAPTIGALRGAYQDVAAEYSLRSIEPPFHLVPDALERFVERTSAALLDLPEEKVRRLVSDLLDEHWTAKEGGN
jgi:hypothetical protein